MEMLLYQSTQFRDVKKILDRAHGFAGLLTAGGIEASRLDVPFVCDQKVLSRYDDACSDVRRILTMQLGLTLPKGFSIPLEAEDLAVFFSQQCGLQQMQDYLTQKRARTQADIQTWLRDRPWDTHPVTAAQAAAGASISSATRSTRPRRRRTTRTSRRTNTTSNWTARSWERPL